MSRKKPAIPAGYFMTMDLEDLKTREDEPVQDRQIGNSSARGAVVEESISLAFVNLNEDTGPTQDMDTRHKVRSHVMRDFQKRKHLRAEASTSLRTLLPKSRGEGLNFETEFVDTGMSSSDSEADLEASASTGKGKETEITPAFSSLESTSTVDPFDDMPVHGSEVLQTLVQYYNTTVITPPNPDHAANKGLKYAAADQKLFHGTMMNAASHLSFVSNDDYASVVTDLKRQTIQLVNGRLNDPVLSISDSNISAVVVLVLLENQHNNVELSNIHMMGLERMINLRGGLKAMGLSGVLRRRVLWADLCNANISGRAPRFEFVTDAEATFPLCARMTAITKAFAQFKSSQPANSPKVCACSEQFREIILEFRKILEARKLSSNVTGKLSDRIYLADRRLYLMYRATTQSPEHHSPDCVALGPACFIAGMIFLYNSLRDLPLAVPIMDSFLGRLAPLLVENSHADLEMSWNGKYQLLLWVLATAANASFQRQWHFELVGLLARVCAVHSVDSFENFVLHLEAVVWKDARTDPNLVALWDAVELIMANDAMDL